MQELKQLKPEIKLLMINLSKLLKEEKKKQELKRILSIFFKILSKRNSLLHRYIHSSLKMVQYLCIQHFLGIKQIQVSNYDITIDPTMVDVWAKKDTQGKESSTV